MSTGPPRPESPVISTTAASSGSSQSTMVANSDPSAELRASVEALLMQTSAGSTLSSLLKSVDASSISTAEVGATNNLDSTSFTNPLNTDLSISSSLSETGVTHNNQASAPDTNDLVAALLAVLQRHGTIDATTSPNNKITSEMGSISSSADDCANMLATPTTASTTASPSPSASQEMGQSKFDESENHSNINSPNVNTRVEDPRHAVTTVASSNTSNMMTTPTGQSLSSVPTSFAPLLGSESAAAQWSGLTDLISTLLTTSGAATTSNAGSTTSTPFPTGTASSTSSSSFIGTAAGMSDIAVSGGGMSELSSPEQDASSILSGLSSIAATLASPGNASLTSGLSSALLGDRATVGDLVSILSPSETISGIATPDSSSPATIRGTSLASDPIVHLEECTATSTDISIPVLPTVPHYNSGLGLPTDPFGTTILSPLSNSRASSGAGSPNASGGVASGQRTAEELLGSIEKSFAGERTPGSGSNCDGDGTSDETPRSLLFHLDGSLNLEFFKVYPCKNESHVHDRKNCPFHHSQRDRRRQPVTYNAEQCEDHFDLEGDFACACPNGDNCDKCHNRHELLYHPDIYKQRFCSSYNHLECHRGRFCAFAHTRDEIRCDLFTEEEEREPKSDFFMKKFKTLWCPYGVQHDWHGCLYAHTYQDCRRSPSIGYGSEPCPYWQKDLHSADYQKRCPFGPRCPYSHGSKEQLYHPAYYKTMPCADYKTRRTCPRSDLCAFYHDISEKRPAIPSTVSTPSPIEASAEESEGTKLYDYTRPIPNRLMSLLQPNFMRPPLFNLDDFEAFGHASRVGSGRRESNSSTHRSGNNSPHSSSRPAAFPSHPWQDSPGYPSIHHHQQPPSFFRHGMSTPASAPGRSGGGYHHSMYPMYNSRSNNNSSGSYNHGHHPSSAVQHHQPSTYNPLQHHATFSGRHQQGQQQFLPSSHHQQQLPSSPYHSSNQRPLNNMYDDRFLCSDSFSTSSSRRPQRSPNSSPMPTSASRAARYAHKEDMSTSGR